MTSLVSQAENEPPTRTPINSASSHSIIVERCCARVGFLGNPSDGFKGKTLSFLVSNFAVTITIQPSNGPLTIVEEAVFDSIFHLHRHSSMMGYSGGLRLVQATVKVFCQLALHANVSETILTHKGGTIKFQTTIPRMVGLSGSSAIVTATFRALLRLYELSLADLHLTKEEFPAVLLRIEQEELGIKAGLQDRVIQAYGGLVHMNFTEDDLTKRYTSLSPLSLPPLYLLYNTDAGGDSGAVHSTVRQRYEAGDEDVISTMRNIANLADRAVECLENKHYLALADLMEANFAYRRQLYGDAVVGVKNIAAAELAQKLGFAVKFTGSGGSFLCLHRPSCSTNRVTPTQCSDNNSTNIDNTDDDGETMAWLTAAEEAEVIAQFATLHFAFERVQLPDYPSYHY